MADDQRTADITAVTAFLAMAAKENVMLNGHSGRDVWYAHTRLLGLSPSAGGELLCRLLGDDPEA